MNLLGKLGADQHVCIIKSEVLRKTFNPSYLKGRKYSLCRGASGPRLRLDLFSNDDEAVCKTDAHLYANYS